MDLKLKGKMALVTGASVGIGQAVAEGLAAEGVNLVIVSRRELVLEQLAQMLQQTYGVQVFPVVADLATQAGCEAILQSVACLPSPPTILINNTGGPPAGEFMETTPEVWEQQAQNLILSVVRLVQGLVPDMKKAGGGRVITISSMAAKEPTANLVLSNTYRAGLLGLTKTLAQELGPYNILVNGVLPGYTATQRLLHLGQHQAQKSGTSVESVMSEYEAKIPLRRLAKPVEVANLVVFLASEAASYISGNNIQVDGGFIKGLL